MSELKTQRNDASVKDFLAQIEPLEKREDSQKLIEIFEEVTGEKATMWGTSIIGFGQYHYKSERSKQEGDWLLTGFSPRKANLTAYIISGFEGESELMAKLGTFKTGVSCLYFKRLSDIDVAVLKELIHRSVVLMKKRYPA